MHQLPSFLPALFEAFGNQSADVRKVDNTQLFSLISLDFYSQIVFLKLNCEDFVACLPLTVIWYEKNSRHAWHMSETFSIVERSVHLVSH